MILNENLETDNSFPNIESLSLKVTDFLVLLPAFNEEKNLPSVIKQLGEYFSPNQLILADDGSKDESSRVARRLRIRIIRNRKNIGKGYILRKSFEIIVEKFSNIKWVLTLDADGQHDPRDIPKFFNTIKTNPDVKIIVGKRDFKKMPTLNWISNSLTSRWSNYWLNWNLHDLQCGFRCYSTDALRCILDYGLTKSKFDLETEILLVAWILNLKLLSTSIGTLYSDNNRKSRIRPGLDTIRWMFLVLQCGLTPRFVTQVWQRRYFRNL